MGVSGGMAINWFNKNTTPCTARLTSGQVFPPSTTRKAPDLAFAVLVRFQPPRVAAYFFFFFLKKKGERGRRRGVSPTSVGLINAALPLPGKEYDWVEVQVIMGPAILSQRKSKHLAWNAEKEKQSCFLLPSLSLSVFLRT